MNPLILGENEFFFDVFKRFPKVAMDEKAWILHNYFVNDLCYKTQTEDFVYSNWNSKKKTDLQIMMF